MQKLISAQKMENILRNGAPEPPTLNELAATDPLVAGVVADLKKDKKQKQRVGVNPVLGNAGVMWESNKKVNDAQNRARTHDEIFFVISSPDIVLLKSGVGGSGQSRRRKVLLDRPHNVFLGRPLYSDFMNRPPTFTLTQNPHDFFQPSESNLVQKRKSVTEDLISPKKSKLAELAETAVSIQNEKFLEKRKDLDSYTGCLPKVNFLVHLFREHNKGGRF